MAAVIPLPGSLTLTIWLFRSSHKEIESIYSPLESGVALGLTLASRMQQKKWASSEQRLKKPWHFSLSWKLVQPLCEQAQAELPENERPWGVKPTTPAEACCSRPRCSLQTCGWTQLRQENWPAKPGLSHQTQWYKWLVLKSQIQDHMLLSKSELIQ